MISAGRNRAHKIKSKNDAICHFRENYNQNLNRQIDKNFVFICAMNFEFLDTDCRSLSKIFSCSDLSPTEVGSRRDNRPEIGLLTLLPKSLIIILMVPHRVTRI